MRVSVMMSNSQENFNDIINTQIDKYKEVADARFETIEAKLNATGP
jgi:hypothetical protein